MSAAAGENIHAGLVAVDGRGILVAGPARSGKSALAISLLRAAEREGLSAALVADDRVELECREGRLFGRAPASLAGLVEISGVGLLRVPFRAEAHVDLLASLEESPDRMPEDAWAIVLGTRLRRVRLPPRQAPFSADILITLLRTGDDALQNF